MQCRIRLIKAYTAVQKETENALITLAETSDRGTIIRLTVFDENKIMLVEEAGNMTQTEFSKLYSVSYLAFESLQLTKPPKLRNCIHTCVSILAVQSFTSKQPVCVSYGHWESMWVLDEVHLACWLAGLMRGR